MQEEAANFYRLASNTVRGHSLDASGELPWKNTSSGETYRWTASIQLIPPFGLKTGRIGVHPPPLRAGKIDAASWPADVFYPASRVT
jgi:hypothetical protein